MPSADVTEFGGWPQPPRWVWAVAGVAAVAVLAGVVVARTGPHRADAASPAAPGACGPAVHPPTSSAQAPAAAVRGSPGRQVLCSVLARGRPPRWLGVPFSPDGKMLAVGCGDGTVRLWNPDTGRPAGPLLRASARNGVPAVAFSPDGTLLASGGGDGTVRLWYPSTGQPAGAPLHASARSGVHAVAFSLDGTLLASGGGDGTVRLWSASTGQPAGAPLHASARHGVSALAFSPDGTLLAAGGSDGTVRLWNPATGRPVGAPLQTGSGSDGGVQWVAFSPDGTLLAAGGGDGTVRLWNPATGQPPADVAAPHLQACLGPS